MEHFWGLGMLMVSSASNSKATLRLALTALLTSLFAIFLSLTLGSGLALAADNGVSAADTDSSTVITDPQQIPSEPPQASQAPTNLSASAAGTTVPQDPADVSSATNLSAATEIYPGDTDSTQPLFIGVVPNSPAYFTYDYYEPTGSASAYTRSSFQRGNHSDSPTKYTRDEKNVAHVYYECNAGEAVDLEGWVDYIRSGSNTFWYDHNMSDVAGVTIASDADACYFMFSWYEDEAPLPQGIYYTDLEQFQAATSGSSNTGGSYYSVPKYYNYDIQATSFIPGDDITFGKYGVPNRFMGVPGVAFTKQSNGTFTTSSFPFSTAYNISDYYITQFEGAGMHTFVLQATLLLEFEEEKTNAQGEKYTYVKHILCTSNPVIFHIKVKDTPVAQLEVVAIDNYNRNIDISDSSKFGVSIYKQYMPKLPYDKLRGFSQCTRNDNCYDYANACEYKVIVSSKNNRFETYVDYFTVSAADITAAGTGGTVTKTITLTAKPISNTLYTVRFVDEDGVTDVIPPQQYFDGESIEQVTFPKTDPTKAEDAVNKYFFKQWIGTMNGTTYDAPPNMVLGNLTFQAVYRAVPKNDVTASGRVYASGGLFSMQKPENVTSYALEVGEPSTATKNSIMQNYAAYYGSNTVVGMFSVDLIQNGSNGTSTKITTGVGALTLNFPADGLADGTIVKVLQLHENEDSTTSVIEHSGLVVQNQEVSVTLNGVLSTFVITAENSNSNGDPTQVNGQTTDPTNNPQNTDEPVNNSSNNPANTNGSSGNNSSGSTAGTTAGGSTSSNASENATTGNSSADRTQSMVKTGSDEDASDDSKPAETGDDTNKLLLMLMAMTTLGTAYAIRRRRKAQAFSS